jgi:hypothetical protein
VGADQPLPRYLILAVGQALFDDASSDAEVGGQDKSPPAWKPKMTSFDGPAADESKKKGIVTSVGTAASVPVTTPIAQKKEKVGRDRNGGLCAPAGCTIC